MFRKALECNLILLDEKLQEGFERVDVLNSDDHQYKLTIENCCFVQQLLLGLNFEYLQTERSSLENLIAFGVTAEGYDFSGMNLRLSQFTFSNLKNADFRGANVAQSSFTETNLQRANFNGADASYSLFTKADMQESSLQNANFSGANVGQTLAMKANFEGANLTMTNMANSDLRDCDFSKASLNYSDLSYANISGSDFRSSDFYYARMHATVDSGARFTSRLGIQDVDQNELKADLWLLS